jgi:hypothetical protein
MRRAGTPLGGGVGAGGESPGRRTGCEVRVGRAASGGTALTTTGVSATLLRTAARGARRASPAPASPPTGGSSGSSPSSGGWARNSGITSLRKRSRSTRSSSMVSA